MPEIDETQLASFNNLQAFVNRGLANPKTRRKLLEVQKELNPDVAVPEIDAANPIIDELRAIREEFGKLREETAKERAEREERERLLALEGRWAEGRQEARKAGYTDEGLTKLEQFMEREGIASHRHAIPAFERENPPPEPVISGSQNWNFFGPQSPAAPDLKPLMEGREEEFLGATIADTLKQIRGG